MGRHRFAVVAKLAARLRVVGVAGVVGAVGVSGAGLAVATASAPAGATAASTMQETPDTVTVEVSFGGACRPYGSPGFPVPGDGYATLTLPTSVEQGETFTVAVEDVGGPPALTDPSSYTGTFAVTGATPDRFSSSNLFTDSFSDAQLTAIGAPGTDVVISLTSVSVRWLPPPWYPIETGQYCEALPPDPEVPVAEPVTASIPIVAPLCLGQPASIVGLPTEPTVAGTPGEDVIVAWAPGAVIEPGGGDDLVCARAGDGTISYADSPAGALVSLAEGTGHVTGDGGGTVRFEGITGARGSPSADVIVGDDGDNVLHGGAGNDVLNGLAGTDTLDGESGKNVLLGDSADTCANGVAVGC